MIKGIFTSVWDGGIEVTTPAELDESTGEIITESVDVNGLENLESESFTDEKGNEYEVCPECHTYIMKTIMVDGIGSCYDEKSVCSDPDCDNGENNL
jgi:hypothetical protein